MLRLDGKTLSDRQEFYRNCRALIESDSIQEKVRLAHALSTSSYVAFVKKDIEGQDGALMQPSCLGRYPYDLHPVEKMQRHPGRPIHFEIKNARDIPRRGSLRTTKGQQQLIHSLAHIELCAVEIDAAMMLCFPHAPPGWLVDWVSILADEQRHFLLLCGLLKDLGMAYGDLPVHFGLWETAMEGRSWLEQMAIVNRYQEASGVDASCALVAQLREIQSQATARIIETIHTDEIRHVSLGNEWWSWAFSHYRLVQRANVPLSDEMGDYFFRIIDARVKNPWKGRMPLDKAGRKKSGFSAFELQKFETVQTSSGGNDDGSSA